MVIQQIINRFPIIGSKSRELKKFVANMQVLGRNPQIVMPYLTRAHRDFLENGGCGGQLQRLLHIRAKNLNTFKGLKLPKE